MNDTHEVISAFLDDEPFGARQLGEALSDPEGRALLIDLVALRHVVQLEDAVEPERAERRSAWRPLAAAAVLVALAGGYFIGERRSALGTSDPPAPSRVVQANEWRSLPAGGAR